MQHSFWFYRVVVNLCLDLNDHNRKKKTMSLCENMEIVDEHDGQEILLDEKRKQALLNRFIQELSKRWQLASNLCFYEGLSNQEIEV